jgi:hypothetical protein
MIYWICAVWYSIYYTSEIIGMMDLSTAVLKCNIAKEKKVKMENKNKMLKSS